MVDAVRELLVGAKQSQARSETHLGETRLNLNK